MQAESPTLENRQEWGTQNSKQRPGHPSEKILNLSISLLLVRLIIRVEVEAVDRPISFPMGTTVCLLRDPRAYVRALSYGWQRNANSRERGTRNAVHTNEA